MIIKSMKLALATSICLLSIQAVAQNGTGQKLIKANAKPRPEVQNVSKDRIKNTNPHQESLSQLYKVTTERLKSPNRLQKMGGMDGGGGNALLCKDNTQFSLTLLDTYEAKELGLKIESKKTDFKEIIEDSLNNLKSVSPSRAAIYKAHIDKLLSSDTQWVENKVMPVIDDVKLATFPHNCLLVQVAVQRPLEQLTLPNAKTYIFNRDLFELLSPIDKAALVLHEVLYRESKYANHENSIFARHLVGLIMSGGVRKYSLRTFNELLSKNGNQCIEQQRSGAIQFRRGIWGSDDTCLGFVRAHTFTTQNKVELKTPQNWPKKSTDLKLEYNGSLVNLGLDGIFDYIFAHPENITPDLDSPIVVINGPNNFRPEDFYATRAYESFKAKGSFKFANSEYSLPSFKFEGVIDVGFRFNQGFQLKEKHSNEARLVDMFNQDPFISVMKKVTPDSRKLGYRFEGCLQS